MGHGRNDDPDDPKGVIREAYRIEGITLQECRSIFLDWALSLPDGTDGRTVSGRLLERHGRQVPDHPMTAVLAEARRGDLRPTRRGGRRGRTGGEA